MEKTIVWIIICSTLHFNGKAQEPDSVRAFEKYGNTLNISAGVAYYSHMQRVLPMGDINFEFNLSRNITLAPFISLFTYNGNYSSEKDPNTIHSYRQTIIPFGGKVYYYLDELLNTRQKWDIYIAGSAGFAYRKLEWDDGYSGTGPVSTEINPFYASLHIGAEYHVNKTTGVFLDLSTNLTAVGVATHF